MGLPLNKIFKFCSRIFPFLFFFTHLEDETKNQSHIYFLFKLANVKNVEKGIPNKKYCKNIHLHFLSEHNDLWVPQILISPEGINKSKQLLFFIFQVTSINNSI